jgi:hypothetical protein
MKGVFANEKLICTFANKEDPIEALQAHVNINGLEISGNSIYLCDEELFEIRPVEVDFKKLSFALLTFLRDVRNAFENKDDYTLTPFKYHYDGLEHLKKTFLEADADGHEDGKETLIALLETLQIVCELLLRNRHFAKKASDSEKSVIYDYINSLIKAANFMED